MKITKQWIYTYVVAFNSLIILKKSLAQKFYFLKKYFFFYTKKKDSADHKLLSPFAVLVKTAYYPLNIRH